MKKCLTICPTLPHRKKMKEEMLASFNQTAVLSDIVFDERMDMTITDIVNDIFEKNKTYEYYFIANDDLIFKTNGWDKQMIDVLEKEGGGIAFGNDTLQEQRLCTFPMISAPIANALGWLLHPGFIHFFTDNVLYEIGRGAKCLFYLPNVVIEHRHFENGKRPQDDPDYDEKLMLDKARYVWWELHNRVDDVRRVKDALLNPSAFCVRRYN